MRSSRSPWLLALVLACAGWFGQPPMEAHADDREYDAIVSEALAEFGRQNWIEARTLFKRAHALSPNARTLRGAGIAAYEAKLYVAAHHDLTAALESKVKPLTAAQRKDIEGILERVRTFLIRLRLEIEPAEAEVVVDGRPVALVDGLVLLDPGAHDLVVRARGYDSVSHRIDAEPGEHSLQVALPPKDAPGDNNTQYAAAPAPLSAPQPAQRASQDDRGTDVGIWPWVATGAAVAFASAAVGFHLAAASGASNVEEACPPDRCSLAEIDDHIDDESITTFDTLAVVSWSVAGAAAATAVVLFVLDGDGEASEAGVSALRIGPGTVAISGRF